MASTAVPRPTKLRGMGSWGFRAWGLRGRGLGFRVWVQGILGFLGFFPGAYTVFRV